LSVAPAVFIVDDDPSVLRATQRVMRAAGLETRAFASAREGATRTIRMRRAAWSWTWRCPD